MTVGGLVVMRFVSNPMDGQRHWDFPLRGPGAVRQV